MKQVANHPIALCSWSLQDNLPLIQKTMDELGLEHIHASVAIMQSEGWAENSWTVTNAMIGFPQEDYSTLDSIKKTGGIMPDDCWEKNRVLALDAIDFTAKHGVDFLSLHAGFIDHTDEEGYQTFRSRITELADAARAKNIMLLLETGQETAEDLVQCLEDLAHPALGVNFDPANMILYDKGDPIAAVHTLAPWVKHVHIKDATKTTVPGEWGAEVPWGDGEVGSTAFIQALEEIEYVGALAIEREAGDARVEDIKLAASRLGERI